MRDAVRGQELRKGAIGVAHIVFFVVAAAAPLTAVVGVSPAAFSLGNGVGVPGTYLVVGLLYIVFSAGFTAMNRFVSSASGFYAYIANGLGKPAGLASALVALATYNAIDIAVYGIFGFFANEMVRAAGGPDIPWLIYAAVLAGAVYVCGMRNIAFSGAVLGACMIAEIAILAVLGLAVLNVGGGPDGISFQSFEIPSVFSKGLGVALVFVVASFLGFEATAIFGEEARDPKHTVARATYIAVLLIAVFYAFATWTITLHYGGAAIVQQAADHAADLYLTAVNERLGGMAALTMKVLLITSLFACALSFHNTINRYLFALGREGVLWRGFARTHRWHDSPYVAGRVQTVFALGVVMLLGLSGADPYAVVFAWMGTFASIGILVMQILVSMSVVMFFRGNPRGIGAYSRLLAPLISMAGLAACLVLMVSNLSLVSGSQSWVIDTFPAIIAAIALMGATLALWMRRERPMIYQNLGRTLG